MKSIDHRLLKTILKYVQKPSQYLGNEVNAIHRDFVTHPIRICLVFPDAYELGMSHNGIRILYEILNRIEGVVAERAFAPQLDMEKELRERNIPWFSLESKTPLKEFDIVGISLPFELTYTNVLNILDLAQIPVWQKDRNHTHPIVLGGGTQSYNPEPMADFFDAIAIGDGEELVLDVVEKFAEWKRRFNVDCISENTNPQSRPDLLMDLSHIEGVYVPSFFNIQYNEDGTIQRVNALHEHHQRIKKRVVSDLDVQPYPTKPIVSVIKLVHDRVGIEIQRGCTRMCRFCQAGYIERPTRQRSPEKVIEIAKESIQNSGHEEVSLLSLSAGDYQTIVPTLKMLNAEFADQTVSISVPATRTETLTKEMINEIKQVRMTGFTIAPEAGSERMRRVINKGNKLEDLLKACDNAFSSGYKLIKFYYMCGLPFETDDDVINIAHESYEALKVGRRYTRDVRINVSVSSLVPKPFTPFQWEPQMTVEETRRKHHLIKSHLGDRNLNFKNHKAEMSYLEGLFARGDRRLSALLFAAFQSGCRFDEWSEHFDFSKWQKLFDQLKVDVGFYLHRQRARDEVLPWDHLFSQMNKDWLWKEFEKAREEAYVADCSIEKCASFCGACDFKEIKNRIFVINDKEIAAKKGNREWYGRFGQSLPEAATPLVTKEDHPNNAGFRVKLRARFKKVDYATFIGHLELMDVLKRALNRNRFPVLYSEGFHPQMRLSMGLALSVGVESECEYFDLLLSKAIQPNVFIEKMNQSLPEGLRITHAEYIDLTAPSIYSLMASIDYQIEFPESLDVDKLTEFEQNLSNLKNGKVFTITRSRPKSNKKPKTLTLNEYIKPESASYRDRKFNLSMICSESGSLKPQEVIAALGSLSDLEMAELRVKKTGTSLSA